MAAVTANGSTAQEFDRLIADFRRHVEQLMAEKQQLVDECDSLRRRVAILEEKCAGYAPIVRDWSNAHFTPEEAERIMRHNKWVEFQQVQQVLDEVQGA